MTATADVVRDYAVARDDEGNAMVEESEEDTEESDVDESNLVGLQHRRRRGAKRNRETGYKLTASTRATSSIARLWRVSEGNG